MEKREKDFYELYKGNRSFSVMRSVISYFSQPEREPKIENIQQKEWNSVLSDDQLPPIQLNHLLYKIKYQLLLEKTQKRRQLFVRVSSVAALLALPLVLLFLVRYNNNLADETTQLGEIELYCPEGGLTKFSLPDGSSGWLAGGSTLRYSANFEKERNLAVSGEAFFNVTRDEEHPFTVKLGELRVKVLGTQFNVLNYSNDPTSEVVVLSGLVEVSGSSKRFTEQLKADRKLQLLKSKEKVYLSEVDAKSYTAWTEGRLEFNNENLESVCRKIERFYDVDVDLKIEGLENNLFRANVKIGSIEELMKYMSMALSIKYELISSVDSKDGKFVRRKLIISKK